MALFFTPSQFSRHAEFYRQMGQLLAVGVPVTNALEHIQKTAIFKRRSQSPLPSVIQMIHSGATFSEAAKAPAGWLPPFDLALLQAGELTGRLDATFDILGTYYETRARIARIVLAGLAYPLFLLHFAIFIIPFPEFFISGNIQLYLLKTFGILIPLYALATLTVFAAQSRHGEPWRAFMEKVSMFIPLLGSARRNLALSRIAASLGALLSAGITVIEAWKMAGAASGSPRLKREVESWMPLLEAGQTPAEVIQGAKVFPEIFAGQYATGEVSGKLDDTLGRLNVYYEQEGTRRLQALALWFPWLVYFVVAGFIIYKVFTFYTGRYQGMQDLLNGF
jgi:type II secretory pathway component PulF